jgi:hypothetical protein
VKQASHQVRRFPLLLLISGRSSPVRGLAPARAAAPVQRDGLRNPTQSPCRLPTGRMEFSGRAESPSTLRWSGTANLMRASLPALAASVHGTSGMTAY